MALSFNSLLRKLRLNLRRLDNDGPQKLIQCLLQLVKCSLPLTTALIKYHNALLYICAYPYNEESKNIAEKELVRITKKLKITPLSRKKEFINSGLPFTHFVSSHTHDCLVWLNHHPHCLLEFSDQSDYSLNELLDHTLPSLERSNTSAGYDNEELLDALGVQKHQILNFYLSQFDSLNDQPFLKDYLFDKLGLEVKLIPTNKSFSKAYNRLPVGSLYYQQDWCKHFHVIELLDRPIPTAQRFSAEESKQVISVIKFTMALNDRETDPTTYLDITSLRLYELDRGITIALYGMIPSRQLPMESYVGFTLFKNGFPAAYGGSWVFGERANFGINIFESFRAGESGYMMCQLLRVYRQAFNISFFEVEPYQFGLDNPEGIASGAFWFYYRHGFRPIDKSLNNLASQEIKKIKANKLYKTRKSTLVKFTESNVALNLGKTVPVSLPAITQKITAMIKKQYKGDRSLAIEKSVEKLSGQLEGIKTFNNDQHRVLEEVALVSNVLNIADTKSYETISSLIKSKPIDLFKYQQHLLSFLKGATV